MPKASSVPSVLDPRCPSRLVLDRIADKWTALVIQILAGGTMRYAALQREIGGISQKMLTQTLRSLERDGLVQRTVHPVVPPKVEYSLTKLGRTLIEPLRDFVVGRKNISGSFRRTARGPKSNGVTQEIGILEQ